MINTAFQRSLPGIHQSNSSPLTGEIAWRRSRPSNLPDLSKLLVSYDIISIKAERCRRSFFYFLQEFWEEISQDTFRANWHIQYLCTELEKLAFDVAANKPKEYDLIINIPPGTTKSITCSIMFPVWCWLNWHWMRFIVASYSSALSLDHAEYSRDLIRSAKFNKYFPDLEIKQDKDVKSNFRIQKRIVNPKTGEESRVLGGNRYSTSVGGTLTGFHAHILIVDDPINPQQAVSDVYLTTANRWVEQTLSTRKVNKEVVPLLMIMQRLHQDDPTGHLLAKRKKNVRLICLPGEVKNYAEQVNPPELKDSYIDGLLDPVRMNWSVLKDLEADLGQYGYAGQIGQRPTPPGGGMFKVDFFQIIDSAPISSSFVQTVRYWDKAGTAGAGAYTAGVKMTKLKTGKFLIHDVKRGQWRADVREAILRTTAEADEKKVQVYVEQEPGSGGKESAEASIRNLAGFATFKDRPTGDKAFRADPYSVQVNNGNVLLLRGDWNHDFIEEHRFFPFSTYKDQVDAASGAFTKLTNKKIARVIR